MNPLVIATDPGTLGGSGLASWTPVQLLLGGFAVVVVVLSALGRSNPAWGSLRALSRAPDSLHRLTGVPGWAITAIGTSLFGLFLAGQGFYADVSWHIALGRDDNLFTAPHTSILVGLVLILGGAVLGTLVATLDRVPNALTIVGLRVPRSLLPLWALGIGAISGFPTDEMWHREYGVDVTMWSPTHMLMILGATFTGLAVWLVLAESGVTPRTSRWGRGLHVVCAWIALQGLVAPLGEFSFGVPQFSQLFAPILLCIAAGLGLVASRIVLGPVWTVGIVAVSLAMQIGDSGPVATRRPGTFAVSVIFVELVAAVLGTQHRIRFALVSGVGIGTLGLAGEWLWNQGATQPWTSNLFPEAAALGLLGAIAGAVLGTGLGAAIVGDDVDRRRIPTAAIAAAGIACLALIIIPLPRATGNVIASIELEPAARGRATVVATLDPPDAADDAYWFQATAWQGGGLELADMEPTGEPGVYRATRPIPIDGHWKSLLRLHRTGEMMAAPVFLPADHTIGEPEIAASDRTIAFASERRYLLRETHDGSAWLSPLVHGFLAVVATAWIAAFILGTRRERSAERLQHTPDATIARP